MRSTFSAPFAAAPVAAGAVAAAGLAEVFGLKKSAKVFFGEALALAIGDAEAAAFAFLVFFAGEADGCAAALAAGEADSVASAFL